MTAVANDTAVEVVYLDPRHPRVLMPPVLDDCTLAPFS